MRSCCYREQGPPQFKHVQQSNTKKEKSIYQSRNQTSSTNTFIGKKRKIRYLYKQELNQEPSALKCTNKHNRKKAEKARNPHLQNIQTNYIKIYNYYYLLILLYIHINNYTNLHNRINKMK